MKSVFTQQWRTTAAVSMRGPTPTNTDRPFDNGNGSGSGDESPRAGVGGTFDSYMSPPVGEPAKKTAFLQRLKAQKKVTGQPESSAPPPVERLEVFVEFDGAWLPAVSGPVNAWSATFEFLDGSTAQVPVSLVQYRVKPRTDPEIMAQTVQAEAAAAAAAALAAGYAARRASRGLPPSSGVSFAGSAPMDRSQSVAANVVIPSHLKYVREDPAVRRAQFEYAKYHNQRVKEAEAAVKQQGSSMRSSLG